jgi:uncharacterized protein (TIGR02001 family)
MKTRLLSAALIGGLAFAGTAVPAFADGEEAAASPWSATLAVTSDYRFRGVSQTDEGVAFQGSIDFASETGFFAGVWASNIDFLDEASYDSSIEVDLYAGYTFELSEATSLTGKFVYYAYPDADAPTGFPDYDYYELIASLAHDFGGASVAAEVAYSPDFFLEVGDAVALTGTITVPLCDKLWFFDGGLAASGHLGGQWFDEPLLIDYTFYDLGLSASAGMFTVDVRWIGTDIEDADCTTGWCDDTVVVTGSFKFGG